MKLYLKCDFGPHNPIPDESAAKSNRIKGKTRYIFSNVVATIDELSKAIAPTLMNH